jgi:hypothetical protein
MKQAFGFALALLVCPLCSQFEMKLDPATTAAFDSYVKIAEQQLARRWNGESPFFWSENAAKNKKELLRGELIIAPAGSPNPSAVPDGLIHDWVGAVFIPDTTVEKVVALLQNFDLHSHIYPEILQSHLIKRDEDDVTGSWRVTRKQQMVPATYDIEQTAHYERLSGSRWICRDHSTAIREVKDPGSAHESHFPVGEGLGLLWRLNAYWSLEARGTGVMAECRTISLSRGIPNGMGWMIRPFIQNVPRESLTSTLRNTRSALAVQSPGSAKQSPGSVKIDRRSR